MPLTQYRTNRGVWLDAPSKGGKLSASFAQELARRDGRDCVSRHQPSFRCSVCLTVYPLSYRRVTRTWQGETDQCSFCAKAGASK